MVIKNLIRYKKRVRYQLTAHPLFIFYGFLLVSSLKQSRDGIPLTPKPP